MEDVKELSVTHKKATRNLLVSILVLMEDVKEHHIDARTYGMLLCFNPCFNGRCKRTPKLKCYKFHAKMFQSLF